MNFRENRLNVSKIQLINILDANMEAYLWQSITCLNLTILTEEKTRLIID